MISVLVFLCVDKYEIKKKNIYANTKLYETRLFQRDIKYLQKCKKKKKKENIQMLRTKYI